MPNVRQRFLRAFGNFAEQESLEARHFKCLSLFFVQRRQPLLNDLPPFLKRQSPPRQVHPIRLNDLALRSLAPVIEIPERQILPAAETAVVGVLKYPYSRTALGRIKLASLVENFKKDVLHHIFRLARVTQDSQRNLQNEPMEAIEENR